MSAQLVLTVSATAGFDVLAASAGVLALLLALGAIVPEMLRGTKKPQDYWEHAVPQPLARIAANLGHERIADYVLDDDAAGRINKAIGDARASPGGSNRPAPEAGEG